MDYKVRELKKSDLSADNAGLEFIDYLIETYNNLSPTPKISQQKASSIFDKMEKQGTIVFVAIEKESKKVIGSITILIEHKLLRGGSMAAHIEDVVVRKGHEGLGIGSAMMQKVIEKAKKLGCYKIILDCEENLENYYGNFGFKNNGIFMRMYL